jgi:hypothetical protein
MKKQLLDKIEEIELLIENTFDYDCDSHRICKCDDMLNGVKELINILQDENFIKDNFDYFLNVINIISFNAQVGLSLLPHDETDSRLFKINYFITKELNNLKEQ